MNYRLMALLVTGMLAATPVAAQSAQKADEPRGALLYATYCIACHTSKIHWREQKRVKDWTSLKVQVRRWQANSGVVWSESDIVEVTRHLNELYYHFPEVDSLANIANAPSEPRR